jgi:predicted O-methyltransferase YrrM
MDFIPKEIREYSLSHTTKENELLAKLNRETWAKVMIPRMLSGHLQGRLLSMYSKMLAPKNILEIGTYTGYSALCLAEGLAQNGKLHTIDCNEEVTLFAKKYFEMSDYKNNIVQHLGNALEIITKIDTKFQLVFIDADKENYCNYYNLVMEKLTVGGYIIADNVLWSGKILNPNEKDKETQSLRAFNQRIQEDNRVENILLPIRDGLMLCRKLLH